MGMEMKPTDCASKWTWPVRDAPPMSLVKKSISLKKLLYYSYCHFIYFYFLAVPHSMSDLSSLTKD